MRSSGDIPEPNAGRARALTRALGGIAVLPWVGGVLDKQAFPARSEWRARFVESALRILNEIPEFAGLHLNIEPWPAGDADLAQLLTELRAHWPHGKILSVNIPAVSSPFGLGWSCSLPEEDLMRVSEHADEFVVSLYNTGAVTRHSYARTVEICALRALLYSRGRRVWLGLPDFPDELPYHRATIENVPHALSAALAAVAEAKDQRVRRQISFAGLAVYAEWTASQATFDALGTRARACN